MLNKDKKTKLESGPAVRCSDLVSHIDYSSDFSYMEFPGRTYCLELMAKVKEIQFFKNWESFDELLNAAAELLGNTDERYCSIYICESCGGFYHGDYSTNSDTNHDYCPSCAIEANG